MGKKATVYLSDNALEAIGKSENLSGRLNSICSRYGAIIAKDCPALTVNQWMMICDILNGTVLDADNRDADPARFLWADISESGKLDGMAEKWEIDTEALSQQVRELPYSSQCAIIEVAARFWADCETDYPSDKDRLQAAGAKITPHLD